MAYFLAMLALHGVNVDADVTGTIAVLVIVMLPIDDLEFAFAPRAHRWEILVLAGATAAVGNLILLRPTSFYEDVIAPRADHAQLAVSGFHGILLWLIVTGLSHTYLTSLSAKVSIF